MTESVPNTVANLVGSEALMHGALGVNRGWAPPVRTTEFDACARATFTDIMAHEYVDQPAVLLEKIRLLADMIRRSAKCITYTGAGISTASGIDDYASKARNTGGTSDERPMLKDWKTARPTLAHRVLVALHEAGYLKFWIQQNHDSLPQKAGMFFR